VGTRLGVAKLKEIALDLLFPAFCVGCGKEGDFLCESCRSSLPKINPPLCPCCGQPEKNGRLCAGCLARKPAIDGVRSPFRFDGVVRQAIYKLKYHNLRALSATLAALLATYLEENPLPVDILLAVPLHRQRIRERGYNQSSTLAKELGRLTGLPMADGELVRSRYTPPQARTASMEERWSNVNGAFTCRSDRLRGKQVLLIDDVATTGATLNACAWRSSKPVPGQSGD
jgi:ComF family protein